MAKIDIDIESMLKARKPFEDILVAAFESVAEQLTNTCLASISVTPSSSDFVVTYKDSEGDEICSISFPLASITECGIMSAMDKAKLENSAVGNIAISSSDSGITFTYSTNGGETKTFTVPVVGTTDGVMTVSDKEKLDNIEEGAEKNPSKATESEDGLMSANDKKKLDAFNTAFESFESSASSTVSVDKDYNIASGKYYVCISNVGDSSSTQGDGYSINVKRNGTSVIQKGYYSTPTGILLEGIYEFDTISFTVGAKSGYTPIFKIEIIKID